MRGLWNFIERSKRRLSRHVCVAVILIAVTFAFAGCGTSGAASTKSDLWSIKFSGKTYHLGEGIISLVEHAEKNGKHVWSGMFFSKIFAVEDDVLKLASIDLEQTSNMAKEGIELSFRNPTGTIQSEDEQAYTILFRKDGNLSKFTSAEGIRSKSKASDLPDYYVSLTGLCTSVGGIRCGESYCAVVADGKAYDLSDCLEELPEKLTPEYLQQVEEKKANLGYACNRLLPNTLVPVSGLPEGRKIAVYEENKNYRNYYAIILALSELKEDYLEGDVKKFGIISFGFDEEGLSGCEYSFFGDKEKMKLIGN